MIPVAGQLWRHLEESDQHVEILRLEESKVVFRDADGNTWPSYLEAFSYHFTLTTKRQCRRRWRAERVEAERIAVRMVQRHKDGA